MLALLSVVPYPSSPSYETTTGFYSTGLYITDIDKNGYKDILVSNGNDMRREVNHIFPNFTGIPSLTPSWYSHDTLYSGHLTVGDINGDGYYEVAVAGFSGYYSGWNRQVNVLYFNNSGNLNPNPYWVSDSGRCFGVASGDVNGDGLSDFAFFCGNDYSSDPEPVKVYISNGTGLSLYWLSDSIYSLGGKFLDVDNDNDLDLFVGVYYGKCRLYRNLGDTLEGTPSWQSRNSCTANQVAVGDINSDGYVDVVVANMGDVLIFYNNGGNLDTNAVVITGVGTYTSAVALGDINGDGWLDLAVGGWWDPLFVFENSGGYFSSPSWSWDAGSDLVSEYIFLADLNRDYVVDTFENFTVSLKGVFTLKHKPIFSVDTVYINGTPTSDFVYSEEDGWVSIPQTSINPGDNIRIVYKFSKSLDMVVSNWEPSRGNFIFLNGNSLETSERFETLSLMGIYDVLGRRVDNVKKNGIYFVVEGGRVKKVLIR